MKRVTSLLNKQVIVYVVDHYPSISQTFVENEISELRRLGVRVYVYPLNKIRTSVFLSEYSGKILGTPSTRTILLIRVLFAFLLRIDKLLMIIKCSFAAQDFRSFGKNAVYLWHANQLTKGFRKLNIKDSSVTVHSHFLGGPTVVNGLLSQNLFDTKIATAHAGDAYGDALHGLSLKLLDSLSCIFASCGFVERELSKHLKPRVKIKDSHPGICIQNSESSISKKWTDIKPLKVVSVGRLEPQKGFDIALQTLQELSKRNIRFVWDIIGDGSLRKEILKYQSRVNEGNEIRLHGAKTHHEVLKMVQSSDLHLLPSMRRKNDITDGIPVSLMESMSLGVLTASTDVGGISELIENLKTGILARAGDAAQLAELAMKVLNDETLHEEIIKEARFKVWQEFNITLRVAEILNEMSRSRSPE